MNLEVREKSILRFALDFLKSNVEDLRDDGMLGGFGTGISEEEIDEIKSKLGVTFQ